MKPTFLTTLTLSRSGAASILTWDARQPLGLGSKFRILKGGGFKLRCWGFAGLWMLGLLWVWDLGSVLNLEFGRLGLRRGSSDSWLI